jgi:hypothetical protein
MPVGLMFTRSTSSSMTRACSLAADNRPRIRLWCARTLTCSGKTLGADRGSRCGGKPVGLTAPLLREAMLCSPKNGRRGLNKPR